MKRLLPAVLAIAGILSPLTAQAFASAQVTVNGKTVSVFETGRDFEVEFLEIGLAPGASADFTFDYSITVQDDGLPVTADPLTIAIVSQCLSTTSESCGPAFTGFEVARASLTLLGVEPRGASPFLQVTSDAPRIVTLETQGDSFAERLTESATVHARVTNTSVAFGQTFRLGLTMMAAWAFASPIPEPQAWLGLLAGLPLVACAARRRRTPAAMPAGSPAP